MTEEQIRQNANDYVDAHWGDGIEYAKFKAFITGAHSRDEEIGELKGKIERQKAIITFDDLNEKALRKELDQLHNPWISVEDRLPEEREIINSAVSVDVLVHTKEGWCTIGYYNHELNKWRAIGNVTHWMPIPELRKGDKQ